MPINTLQPRTSEQVQDILTRQEAGEESTWKNYWDAFNPIAITGTRPELRMNTDDLNGDGIDVEDPEIQAILNDSTPEQQLRIVNAFSKQHAFKVYALNKAREEALTKISGDPLTTQLAMGAIPAIMTPSSLLPVGVLNDVFKVGRAASTLANVGRGVASAGIAAGTMGALDEAMFEQQGIEGHPMSAFVYGAAFGGTIGGLGSMFVGNRAQHNAKLVQPGSDTWTKDFARDPHVTMGKDQRGVPYIADVNVLEPKNVTNWVDTKAPSVGRMNRSILLDNPLMDWLNSDITKVYQHTSSAAREIMSKLAAPVNSILDAAGNITVFGRTAHDFKIGRKKAINTLKYDFDKAFVEAKQNYGFQGNKKAFKEDVEAVYFREANNQNKALYEYIEQKVNEFEANYGDTLTKYLDEEVARTDKGKKPLAPDDDAIETMAKAEAMKNKERNKIKAEAEKEFYTNYKPKFEHGNPAISKGAMRIHEFFKDHLKVNKELKLKGTADIPDNRVYAPRLIDWQTFKNEPGFLAQLREDVFRALRAHPANNDLLDSKLRAIADEYTKAMSDVNFKQNFTHDSFVAPEAAGTARLENRKFHLDEEIMSKYWIRDMDELTSRYQYQMSGRQAISYGLGFDVGDAEAMTKFMDDFKAKMLAEGLSDKELASATTMIENTILDISGQLRMNALSDTPAWQFTRGAMAYNSARLGAGFGGNQLIELVASVFMNGIPNIMNGRVGKSFKNAAKVLYTDSKQADEFAEFLLGTGYFEDALHTTRINRFADTEAGWNSSMFEGVMNKWNDFQYKWNGMRYFKTVMEDMSGSAAISELQRLAKKKNLSKSDKARIALMGLDEAAFRDLASDLSKNVNFKKDLFNLQGISAINRDRLQLAVQRHMEHIVIQGDTVHLPTWFKVPNAYKSLMTQFLRFPMIAHNIFLRRGLTDDQARMFGASVGSVMTFMGMQYLREQGAIAVGLKDRRDAKYNYFDPVNGTDNMLYGIQRGLGYTATLGMTWNMIQASYAVTGQELPGQNYRGQTQLQRAMGPTVSAAQDMIQVIQGVTTDDFKDEKTLLKAKGLLTPNIMWLDEGLKDWIRENY